MGRGTRPVPKQLSGKLRKIRLGLDLTQEKMVEALAAELAEIGYSDIKLYPGHIAEFERGKREPSLPVLLAYALVSKINLNSLVDDRVEISL